MSAVSGMVARLSATVTGVRVSASAAISAANGPAQARTIRCSSHTVSTPSTTCGSAAAQVCGPKSRTETASGQKAPGSLSMLIEPAASSPPKKNARQLPAIERIAAP